MVETAEPESKTKVLARVETSVCGLVLNNLEDMKTVAQLILQSKLAPPSFDTAEKIFVGLQSGAEIGLKPMQSLNSIVVIKGKPTLWGDAALALVKKSGLSEYCKEYFELGLVKISEKDLQYADLIGYPDTLMAVCETKRKGEPEPVIRYFSVADAKLAHLWGKTGPWSTHPKRMLKYKARAFNLRDSYPDVLYGMHLMEEFIGEEPLPAPETDVLPREARRSLAVTGVIDEPVIEGQEPSRAPVQERRKALIVTDHSGDQPVRVPEDELQVEQKKPEPGPHERAIVAEETFAAENAKNNFLIKPEPKPAEPVADFYIDVNGLYVIQGGKDFTEFAAFVLCVDEGEVDAPSKFTMEQLKTIKAYIETSGVAIN